MKRTLKTLIAAAILLVLALPVFAQSFKRDFDIPAPMLLYPTEKADITGKDVLKLKWDSATMDIDHLEFKIYKGYGASSANLIFSQDVSSAASTLELKSGLFEDGQTYNWQMRAISGEGYKSDWSFDSFKVTKK